MTKLAQRLGIPRFQADEHYRAALAAFISRDLAKAIAELQFAVELLPGHAEYHAALGFVLLDDKQHRKASECFERALKLNPYEMLANYSQGTIAYRAKNWQVAVGYFSAARVAQPERPETLYYLAMVNHRLGRNAEALRWIETAAAGFASSGDRREAHCNAWKQEFHKLLELG